MADLNQSKNSNPLKTILDSNGNNVLLSNGISSLNFDGLIPKSSSLKVVSDIKVGDVVSDAEFSQAGKSYLITRVLSQDLMSSNITTTLYFLYYLSDTDGEKQLTYSSDYLDSYEGTQYYGGYSALKQLYVLSDDINNINLGTNGWFISNAGNAVFSNGFFRGRIEATEGIFSGKVFAGDRNASVVIGKDLFDGGEFRDSDTFVSATPTGVISVPSGTETHGLLMDNNNYFFTFSGQTPTNITSVVVSDTTKTDYEYYATFTYTTPSFTFDINNRIDRYSNIDISGIVDSPDTNTDLGTLNRSFTPTNVTIDGTVSRSGTTATINCTAHGLSAGNTVEISGFVGDNYSVNGFWTVSATGLTANVFQVTTTESGTINATRSSKTVTFTTGNTTIATTSTAHGLSNGDSIQFTTTGTLPSGLSTGATYYIIDRTDLTFIVSNTYNGSSVITTSAGSGTHTVNVLNIDQSAALTKAGTFTVKLPSELTQYVSTYPTTVSLPSGSSANNLVLPETLALTSVVLSRKTITTDISSVNAYLTDASQYIVGESITFANFGTSGSIDLTPLNNTFAITAINTTGADYLTFTTNKITAGTYTFSSNYPYISQIGQISKFKVGSSTNYMKYDSGTNELAVTGTINKINIGRGGGDIATNIIYGVNALENNTTGAYNIAFGVQSMLNSNNSNYNISIGTQALYSTNTGDYNVALGYQALKADTSGDYNIAIGANSLSSDTTGSYNIAMGQYSLSSATTGNYNTAIGYYAGWKSTGDNNVLIGNISGADMTTGTGNVGVGGGTLRYNTGSSNIAMGINALFNNTGDNNVAIGLSSLYSNQGSNNIAIGNSSLNSATTSNNNVALGFETLNSIISGDYSVAIGYRSLKLATGSQNLAIGYAAGQSITTGSKNVIIGGNSGSSIATSSNRLIISDGDGSVFFTGDNLQNVTIPNGNFIASTGRIGYDFNASTSSTTQRAFIDPTGGFLWAAKASNTALYLQRTGSLGTIAEFYNDTTRAGYINITGASALAYVATSDYRIKENVTPIKNAIFDLLKLRPVTYYFSTEINGQLQQGFLAHELKEVVPTAAFGEKDEVDSNGNPVYQGTDVAKIVPLLTAALQESIKKIEDLEKRIALLEDK
jgi:hypothetical protein